MHDAYEAAPILEKLPLQIESIACCDDTLLVGTKQGHLLVYKVKPIPGAADSKYDVALEMANKSFAKRPITQLEAVPHPQFHILISLSDNQISVHDLSVFAQITTLTKTKGATLFSIDLKEQKSLSGEVQYTLRMCVAVKRKLQLFYYKNRDFHELQPDLGVPDVPKAMAWCKESLCVGFKRDYFLINISDGSLKDLFPTGKQLEPTVMRLTDDRLALSRDEMTIFIDSEGNPAQKYALTWTDIPGVMEHHPPYIIAVLPKYVEVRTIDPRLLIQSIELNRPKFICQCRRSGHLYVASGNFVWRLASKPITAQIKQLLESKEFELALKLANMTDDNEVDKADRLQKIRTLYAFELFCQHRFEDSLTIFAELGTDPSHVIGLYPNLLPQEYRKQLNYPDELPELNGGELEKGLLSLIDYLMEKRNSLMKDYNQNKELRASAIVEGNATIKSKRRLGTIIDTTLLKCYIETNDALVAPLLRLKDSNCHVEESERVLKQKNKYSELIILYEKKGMHKRALDLLFKQSQKPGSPLKGHERTVMYLQHLGSQHLNLIFEFSEWVLKTYPEDGLKIFTEDILEVETLPREELLDFLERVAKDLAIPYLEHIISNWDDTNERFHNRLINLYRERVQSLMDDYIRSLPQGKPRARAGEEPGELGKLRKKLINFLGDSTYYTPEKLLTHFPFDAFYEERALLLGRLGRHEQALAIYVHILQDVHMAEDYCKRTYDKSHEGNKEVYLSLLKMYLSPPDLRTSLGINPPHGSQLKSNIEAALNLLKDPVSKMDTAKAIEMLPSNILVRDILAFLEDVLEERAVVKRDCQILKSLLYAEHLQVQEQRMHYQKVRCVITEEKMCRVCRKKIGNSAFARYPNGVIVHYFCCKDPKKPPVDL
ncbi:vam6/Vps39-like protein [Lineus longissimus]|uniref:vam6/Vps39-like protein n=1 Tax=Lineus longissimus TaxID=88925 RepID=UPI002B4CE3C5